MESSTVIHINPVATEAESLWSLALELAQALGPEREWSLIGGLMVQLHGLEHDDELRPTVDIDLLGDARKPPAMTEELASLIAEKGAKVAMPPRTRGEIGYRFELDGEIIEILGPDGLKSDPNSPPIAMRRPSLLGAILIKARGKFDSDRQDLIRLLSYVEDPRRLARDEQLKATEKTWLRKVERALNFEGATLTTLFPPLVIERAQQAFRLLSA